MRIVFMGTPDFAVASLKALIESNYNVVGVITAPDKPAGRGQQITQSAVKKYAVANHLLLLQPTNLKDETFINDLAALNADLQIVVAFRMLPEKVWNMPKLGTYNLHASLLPKYRGAAPINWAIMNGETESGVTTFKLKHEIDTGNILFRERADIKITDNAGSLHDLLMELGASLITKTAEAIAQYQKGEKQLYFIKQDEITDCHAPKIFKEDCRINWQKPVIEIYNHIRGLSPYPTAFTQLSNGGNVKTIKVFGADFLLTSPEGAVAAVKSDNKTFLHVMCSDGIIAITDLQIEGKKRMPVLEFLKGFKIDELAKMI